ncbi:MAG: response regulator [Chloroflexi bacterium]|nr:response regulator [Chloroflexota bacterium]
MPDDNSRTVLVIDDDQDIVSLVAMVLEAEGYTVQTAADGREGLQKLERDMPDLILLDMKMPVMDGWEFAREFHARHDSKVPIVVLTAAADARRRAEEIGAQGWIGKPFDLDTLVVVVDRYATLREQ